MNRKYQQSTDYQEDIAGNKVDLQIIEFKDGFEVNVKTRWKYNFRWKCFALGVLVLLNLLALRFNLIGNFSSVVIFIVIFLYMYNMFYQVREESLLVIKWMGYQITAKYVMGESVNFIPWDGINDVFINEVISFQRVLFVLTLYTKDSKLIPLFLITKLRLKGLKQIYKQLKNL